MKIKLKGNLFKVVRLILLMLSIITIQSFFFSSFASYGHMLEKRFSLTIKNETLEDAIINLQNDAKIYFAYDRVLLSSYKLSDISFQNERLEDILNTLFEHKPLTYKEVNGIIVINESAQNESKPPQPGNLKGKVLDEKGVFMPGATVKLAELNKAVKTDENGNFQLTAPAGTYTLEVSYVSYQTQRVQKVIIREGETSTQEIRLQPGLNGLNEVVVVGYGTQKKVNLTGAVSQVDSKVFDDRPVAGVAQALQGAIPNLNINFGDGHPGSTGTFNVRGYASITNVAGSPLILIDGVQGDINMLNAHDVETVTVLKDAASSAIYGARAAFGVILVTKRRLKTASSPLVSGAIMAFSK